METGTGTDVGVDTLRDLARTNELDGEWLDLILGLTILASGAIPGTSPTMCEHDVLHVLADPERFSPQQLSLLGELGFHPSEGEGFYSFRFGNA